MDDYVDAAAVGAENQLVVVQPPTGPYGLLVADRTGAVRYLAQSADADTGWIEETLGSDVTVEYLVAAVDAQGGVLAFARANGATGAALTYARRDPVQGWGAWTTIAPDQNPPTDANVAGMLAIDDAGTIRLFATLAVGEDAAIWETTWADPVPQWTELCAAEAFVLSAATLAGLGQSILFTTASDSQGLHTLTALSLAAGSSPTVLAPDLAFTAMATGMQPSGASAIFIANDGTLGDVAIQYLDGAALSAGFNVIDSSIAAASLTVAVATASPIALFALDKKGVLQLISAPTEPVQGDDFDFSLPCTRIATAIDRDGNPELVAQMAGVGLIRLWRDPPQGPQGRRSWSQTALRYTPASTVLTQSSTYAVSLAFYDGKGVPIANSAVTLLASEIAPALIGRDRVLLGPRIGVRATTDAAGRCRLTLPVTSINCPLISAALPDTMAADESFSVAPDVNVRTNLGKITVDQVEGIVAPAYAGDAEAIQSTIQQCILAVSPGPDVVRYQTGDPGALWTSIRGDAGRGGAHAFRVAGGRATFTPLDSDEARRRIEAIASDYPDDLFDDFDDAMEEVGDALGDAVDYTYDHVLTPVADGITIGVTFIADGIQIAWTGLVETVEDAFRFIETALAAVGAFFKQLYDFLAWLLSDALEAIRATNAYLETLATNGFATLQQLAASASTMSGTFFATIEQTISASFEDIERSVTGDDANQAIDQQAPTAALRIDGLDETILEVIEDGAAVSNWFFDRITDILGLDFDSDLPEDLLDAAQTLIEKALVLLKDTLGTICSDLVAKLQTLASSTDDFGNVLLSTLFDEVRVIIVEVLKILDELVKDFLAFIAQYLPTIVDMIMAAAIGNGLAQALYELIIPGEELTVLRLGTLIAAFVGTVAYKLIFDTVPFATDENGDVVQSEAGTLMILAGVVQTTLWLIIDIKADLPIDDPDQMWLYFASLFLCPLLIQLLTWPVAPFTEPSFKDPQSEAKWVAWLTGFAGSALMLVWGVLLKAKVVDKGPRGSFPGSICLAACGGAAVGTNTYAALMNGASTATWISGIASPISSIAKPAKHMLDPESAIIFLSVVDVIADAGGGIAKIVRGSQMSAEAA